MDPCLTNLLLNISCMCVSLSLSLSLSLSFFLSLSLSLSLTNKREETRENVKEENKFFMDFFQTCVEGETKRSRGSDGK